MSEVFGFDAFSPKEIAQRVESTGVAKARLPLLSLSMLAVLAGAFIGLGAMYYTIVRADATLSPATAQVLGGVVFSLGLLLVSVAGAELFTGNNLLVMAWADRLITSGELLRNWFIVCIGNFIGAAGMALLVYWSGHPTLSGGAVAETTLRIASVKCELPIDQLFVRGMLCNVLVCLAAWMTLAGRTVVDKAIAIVFPISAFVAAGFEHSIANMYFIPLAMLLGGSDSITWHAFLTNLGVVIAGNLAGGSVLVGLIYHLIYRRGRRAE